jgi:hypothetical protein
VANPIVQEIKQQTAGLPRRRRRRYRRAATAIGIVETGLRELRGGDADSENWRQERRSVYGRQWAQTGGPNNTRASVRRVLGELAQHDRGQPIGQLAADVQRPAAQYRDRYGKALPQARAILRGTPTGRGGAGRGATGGDTGTVRLGRPDVFNLARRTSFDQAGFEQAQRRSLVAQMLQRSGRGNSSLFRTGLLSTAAPDPAQFTSSRLVSSITRGTDPLLIPGGGGGGELAPGRASKAVRAARKRLGVSEVGTSNRGPQVDRMSRRFGMVGVPWCGIFLGTVLRKAGVHVDSRVASVAAIETMARTHDGGFAGFTQGGGGARRGDALITRKGQHVAFVERVDSDGTIHTIGGNESGRVQRSAYRPGTVYGVAHVHYRR